MLLHKNHIVLFQVCRFEHVFLTKKYILRKYYNLFLCSIVIITHLFIFVKKKICNLLFRGIFAATLCKPPRIRNSEGIYHMGRWAFAFRQKVGRANTQDLPPLLTQRSPFLRIAFDTSQDSSRFIQNVTKMLVGGDARIAPLNNINYQTRKEQIE